MDSWRRNFLLLSAVAPATRWVDALAAEPSAVTEDRLVLSDFAGGDEFVMPGASWRGFSDRVMGGVSDAEFRRVVLAGRKCVRLSGRVTRDNGGGFIQMALDLGSRAAPFDGSAYAGLELLVYGNDEDYNCHIRTSDCGWYDQSYRLTFRAQPRWQRLRFAWRDFAPNGVTPVLDTSTLRRIALLGWMRDFRADIALAEMSLYQ